MQSEWKGDCGKKTFVSKEILGRKKRFEEMEWFSPKTISETAVLMRRWRGKATLVAGGTNVIPDMRARVLKSDVLIDISRLKSLAYIKEEEKKIRIGSLTTISELASSKVIQKYAPILSQAANQLGNPLVRNRATIGGNLADASPAADTAVPLLALEAMVVAERDGGKRGQTPIDQFFTGPNRTVLRRGEMIKEIIFPKPNSNAKMGYSKLGLRNAMAISIVSVAILMEMDGNKCRKLRIGLGAVAPKPIRAYRTEEILMGNEITTELIEICGNGVEKEISPITDIRASAEYRRSMTSVFLKRLIRQVTE
jgi:CO/xanthine dehydrogenase FAD-binding subunit